MRLVQYNDTSIPVVTNFTCQREMVRDFDKEALHNDGYAYWRTTGRTVVMWASGAITYLIQQERLHSPVVIDCGYDESLPF